MVNPENGRDFHPLAEHVAKRRHFTKGEIRELSASEFSYQLMFDHSLSDDFTINT